MSKSPDEIVEHSFASFALRGRSAMICVSALYPNTPGTRFDGDYYLTTHAALATAMLEPHGLIGVRLSVGQCDLQGGPPPFWAISELHFASRQAFDDAMGICGAVLFEDAKNYTNVDPIMQLSTPQTD